MFYLPTTITSALRPTPKTEDGVTDSIYNGARDNAIGVTAVLNAARYFAKHPPKRSVLFVLYTAEEMGLLGSHYFSDNPLLPLKKIVYNLNCDNGGYNDTSIVTVIGLGRTSADDDIKAAAAAYGVKATSDPVPELNLFDRSDNLKPCDKRCARTYVWYGHYRFRFGCKKTLSPAG